MKAKIAFLLFRSVKRATHRTLWCVSLLAWRS